LRLVIIFGTAAGLMLVAAGLYFSGALERIPTLLTRFWVVDSGALRVAWANYQVSSVSGFRHNIDG
jgi:hypothetical protein